MSDICYQFVETKAELNKHFDKLIECSQLALKKTGEHGITCEILMDQMIRYVETGYGCLLLGFDIKDELVGFLWGVLIKDPKESWVEITALWSKPGVGSLVKFEAFNLLEQWARARNATKILACVTRSPDVFYEFFYMALGFKKVGYLLEARL